MSIGEVVGRLGLGGNWIGGRVGIRDTKVLMGIGLCFTVCDITIVELNPPEVKFCVRGLGRNGYEPTFNELTVDIEDLMPVTKKEIVVEKNVEDRHCSWNESCAQNARSTTVF